MNIKEIFEKRGVKNYSVVLVDCDNKTRRDRLIVRGQGELATDNMMNYAKQFRDEAQDYGIYIIDNSEYEPEETMEKFNQIFTY